MLQRQPSAQRHLNHARAGMATIEYAVVSSLIIVVLVASIYAVGQSTKQAYTGVVNSLDATSKQATPVAVSLSDNQSAIDTQAVDNGRLRFLLLFTAFALTVMGIRYMWHGNRTMEPVPGDPAKANVSKQQSEALRHIFGKRNLIHRKLSENWIQMLQGDANISPYMSTDVVSVPPTMSCQDCLDMLIEKGYRRVMVTDGLGRLLGVVSKKDIQSKTGEVVADVMTSDPKIASPETSLRIALSLLIAHRVSCIPIVENGLLVGILSTSDLLVVLQSLVVILSDDPEAHMPDDDLETVRPQPAPFINSPDIQTSTLPIEQI